MSPVTTSFSIRNRESLEDFQTVTRLTKAFRPDLPYSVEGQKHNLQMRTEDRREWNLLVSVAGEDVAFVEVNHDPHFGEDKEYFLDVVVRPDLLGDPLEAALWEEAIRIAREDGAKGIFARSFSTHPTTEANLESAGFQRVQTQLWTCRRPQEFDPAPFAEHLAAVESSGIRICSLADLEAEGFEWERQFYDSTNLMIKDVPIPVPYEPEPFEQFYKSTRDRKLFSRESTIAAMDGEKMVGVSMLQRKLADPDLAGTGLTATLREYRRRGLAKAMKVRALTWAKEAGIQRIVADNEKNNPMYLLNLQLGFEDAYSETMWRRVLSG